MTRSELIPYVVAIIDDTGGVVTPNAPAVSFQLRATDDCVLVGFQTGFEPTAWAVRSYLGVEMDLDDAQEIVAEHLAEIGWFADRPQAADYVFPPEGETALN